MLVPPPVMELIVVGPSSASLFGWGIASFAKGYSGDSRLLPVKAFGVASLFVGGVASGSVVVLQYYGIRKGLMLVGRS